MQTSNKTPARIRAEAEASRPDLTAYCQQCGDQQLKAVLTAERAKASTCNSPYSSVGRRAAVFAEEAEKEINRRATAAVQL